MEISKTSRGKHGDQTSDFSKIWCGVGLQNPNGSKSQTGQGISPCPVRLTKKKYHFFEQNRFSCYKKKKEAVTCCVLHSHGE
jgi:hypothetical protein